MKNNKQLAALIPYLFVMLAVMSLMFMNFNTTDTTITYQQYVELLNKNQVDSSNVTISEVVLKIEGLYTDSKGVAVPYSLNVPNTELQTNTIIDLVNAKSDEVLIIDAYETNPFWDLVSEIGADVVIGVDAHDPEDFLDFESIARAEKTLKEKGIKVLERLSF